MNEQALIFLSALGIKAWVQDGVVLVDRTSMVCFFPRLDENSAYTAVLQGVQDELGPGIRVYWCGRTDDWMGLAFRPRM